MLFTFPGHVVAWEAWRDCIPNSIGPGGCDSIGPGGGKSIGPGGGLSIGPGGGMSIGPGGGQSIGPGGGQSIGPGGGKSLTRDQSRGLDPDTLRPYPDAMGGQGINMPSQRSPIQLRQQQKNDGGGFEGFEPAQRSTQAIQQAPNAPLVNYSRFDTNAQKLISIDDPIQLRLTYRAMQLEGEEIIRNRMQFLAANSNHSYPDDPELAAQLTQNAISSDPDISDVKSRLTEAARLVRIKTAGQ